MRDNINDNSKHNQFSYKNMQTQLTEDSSHQKNIARVLENFAKNVAY